MRILLDECVPRRFGKLLTGHDCASVGQCGWAGIVNGKLLRLAEGKFEAIITVDQNLTYQQNLTGLSITVIVWQATSNAIEDLEPFVPRLLDKLANPLPRGSIVLGR